MKRTSITIIITLCIYTYNCSAGSIHSNMEEFLHEISADGKTQESNYYSFGSLKKETPIIKRQVAQVDIPHFTTGCGGINLHLGGIGFIKAEQFVETAKDIMNNAGSLAFKLAVEQGLPMVAKIVENLQDSAQKINAMNIHSCEVATSIVGSMASRMGLAEEANCALSNIKYHNNYSNARMYCKNTKTKDTSQNIKTNDSIIETNLNIGLAAIKTIENDTQMQNELMTLSGTIIVTSDSNGSKYAIYPSKLYDKNFVNSLFNNSNKATSYYYCNDPKCLSIVEKKQTYNTHIKNLINARLQSIINKIRNGEKELSNEEQQFIFGVTELPLMKLLQAICNQHETIMKQKLNEFSLLITAEILDAYIVNILTQIEEASYYLMKISDEHLRLFRNGIKSAKNIIKQESKKRKKIRNDALQFITKRQKTI